MACIKLASYLKSLSGSFGDFVFFNKYGREYARIYVKPVNPNTEEQRFIRGTFGDAVRSWQESPQEEKERWNRLARKLAMSGYNLYISRYMKQNVPVGKGFAAYQKAIREHSSIQMNESFSVSTPFCLKHSISTSLLFREESPGI